MNVWFYFYTNQNGFTSIRIKINLEGVELVPISLVIFEQN